MSNDCLQSIVKISDPCNPPAAGVSGFDLMEAPEISLRTLANMASAEQRQGMELARRKLAQAVMQVKSDFMGALHTNNVITRLVQPELNAAAFNTAVMHAGSTLQRGFTLIKSTTLRGKLRKLYIRKVQVFPLAASSSAFIRIYDAGMMYGYPVTLVPNQENTFNIQREVKGRDVRIVLDAPGVPVAGSILNCSCNGSLPDGSGEITGWNGTGHVKKEGHGLNVGFQYACDYDQLLCDLSTAYIAELIWLKARVLLLEERLRTDRLNNWIVYNRDEAKEHRKEVESDYREKWNMLMGGLYDILKNYRDDCITCRGPRFVTNL